MSASSDKSTPFYLTLSLDFLSAIGEGIAWLGQRIWWLLKAIGQGFKLLGQGIIAAGSAMLGFLIQIGQFIGEQAENAWGVTTTQANAIADYIRNKHQAAANYLREKDHKEARLIFQWVLQFLFTALFSGTAYVLVGAFPSLTTYIAPSAFVGLTAYVGFLLGRVVAKLFTSSTFETKSLKDRIIPLAYAVLGCVLGATVANYLIPGPWADIFGPVLGIFGFHYIGQGILQRRTKLESTKETPSAEVQNEGEDEALPKEDRIKIPYFFKPFAMIGATIAAGLAWYLGLGISSVALGPVVLPGVVVVSSMILLGSLLGVAIGGLADLKGIPKGIENFLNKKGTTIFHRWFHDRVGRITMEGIGGAGFLLGNVIGVAVASMTGVGTGLFPLVTLGCGVLGALITGISGFFAARHIPNETIANPRKTIGATMTAAGTLVGIATGAFCSFFLPGAAATFGAAIGAAAGFVVGGFGGAICANPNPQKHENNMGTAVGTLAGANIGILIGGVIGTAISPGFGTAMGAMVGSVVGSAVGFVGMQVIYWHHKRTYGGYDVLEEGSCTVASSHLSVSLSSPKSSPRSFSSHSPPSSPSSSPSLSLSKSED